MYRLTLCFGAGYVVCSSMLSLSSLDVDVSLTIILADVDLDEVGWITVIVVVPGEVSNEYCFSVVCHKPTWWMKEIWLREFTQ